MAILSDFNNVSPMIPSSVFTGGTSAMSAVSGFVPQIMLGDFMFSLNSAAYQEWRRQVSHRWQSQEVFGKHEILQYLGPGAETIVLPGVIYPTFRGGTGQIDKVRALAATGKPQTLVTALGGVLGDWVIESVEETHRELAAFGVPRKIEFNIALRNYSSGDGFDQLVSAIQSLF